MLKHAIFDAVSLCSFHFSNLVSEAPMLQMLMRLHILYPGGVLVFIPARC